MARWFNIAGPCFPDEHYMIPPERRVVEALELIEGGRWFMLVSGRQTGKTTAVQWLREHLNRRGSHVALWVDLQGAREQPDLFRAMTVILGALDDALARDAPTLARPSSAELEAWLRVPESALRNYLSATSRAAAKPLVLLFDEADALVGPSMVSFLTQLRELYLDRKQTPAPWCVALVGVRAVRDYAVNAGDARTLQWLGTVSPFNVTVESVGLAPFTAAQLEELLAQHTADTGQRFDVEARSRIMELSQGHPWLVNALADQVVRRDVRDRARAITRADIDRAKDTLIFERRTHIDSLLARLKEPRVRAVLDAMISGERVRGDNDDDDIAYTAGLGLIRKVDGAWTISNAIYREVVLRTLTSATQDQLDQRTEWYVRADGSLDLPKLMGAWQDFWRRDGHLAAGGFGYQESGPHLMLMAFLQRVVNGGGRIEREYALGKGALDLLVEWKDERHAIELKLRRDTETEKDARVQITRYLDSLGVAEGWLVLFDLRAKRPWSKRLFTKTVTHEGKKIHVVGC